MKIEEADGKNYSFINDNFEDQFKSNNNYVLIIIVIIVARLY